MWLCKYDFQENDAEDLLQDVLLAVSKDLFRIEHHHPVLCFARTSLKKCASLSLDGRGVRVDGTLKHLRC